jgi:hypothetical protein
MFRQMLVDLSMPWHRLLFAGSWIFEQIVPAAPADQ